jgi:serine/threonine-protein kinase
VLHAPIARGGMATIHLARLLGAEGWSRMVAAKRLHPQLTEDPELVKMFLDEARIASKIHHPNVVPVLDVVNSGGEVILVQEYVHGVPLDKILRAASTQKRLLPVEVVIAVAADMLHGLAAAHDAKDELGESLGIVHRDVSPHNVMVGVDGIARLLDFGIAKASLNAHVTRTGVFKGKIAYTSPEQLRGEATLAADLYAAGVVIWEALAGRRLYGVRGDAELIAAVTAGTAPRLAAVVDEETTPPQRMALIRDLDKILARAMAPKPEDRFASGSEMAEALLAVAPAATAAEVSRWVKQLGKEYLEGREALIVAEESTWRQRASGVPLGAEEPSSKSAPGTGTPPETLRPSVVPVVQGHGRAQRLILLALALIGALLAGILAILLRRAPEPAAAPASASVAIAQAAKEKQASTPEAAPTSAVTATVTASASASATATATAVAAPARARGPARSAPAPRAAEPAPAANPAPANDCNPPFYFDGKKKVFKPGCL